MACQTNLFSANCPKHEERLKYYCEDCQEPVCSDCRLKNHAGHKAQDLQASLARKQQQQRLQMAAATASQQLQGTVRFEFEFLV
jgi:hypothetical protein